MCALHCAQLLHTILHRTGLIIFPLILQDNHPCSDDVYLRQAGCPFSAFTLLFRQQEGHLACYKPASILLNKSLVPNLDQ